MNIDDYIDMFAACVIRDAINHATGAYWDRRADELEQALPRIGGPGGYPGRSTADERAAREARLRTKVAACRNAAAFWRHLATGIPLADLVAAETHQRAAA